MLTMLEIIGLQTSKDTDKAEGLRLLTAMAIKGRQYKELLCESFGALGRVLEVGSDLSFHREDICMY